MIGRDLLASLFDTLGDIITKFPRQAEHAKFLFIPGIRFLYKDIL